MIFGNGFGSTSGDAGIYIMTIDPNTGAQGAKFYYLSTHTGSAASPNGIAYVAPADLDGDHITDYVYAGDLQGNVWRFDITDPSETNWVVTPGPMFSTGGQPITTQLVVAAGSPSPGTQRQVMVLFGTGQKTGITNTSAATYAGGTQALYGVWDWNLSATMAAVPAPAPAIRPAGMAYRRRAVLSSVARQRRTADPDDGQSAAAGRDDQRQDPGPRDPDQRDHLLDRRLPEQHRARSSAGTSLCPATRSR